jgi:hypothetical protein
MPQEQIFDQRGADSSLLLGDRRVRQEPPHLIARGVPSGPIGR